MPNLRFFAAVLALSAGASCGGPANVAGNYTLALTNKDNGCNFTNWTANGMTSGVPMVITQNNSAITGMVTGAGGTFLDLALGSHTFTGTVVGPTLAMALHGTTQGHSGNCAYTYTATATATLSGDAIQGTIDYTPETNKGTDCTTIEGCKTTQAFNGTRPPM